MKIIVKMSAWFLMLGNWSFRHYFWNNWKRYIYVENNLDAAGTVTTVVISKFCELCNSQEISVWVNMVFPFFRWNIMKILKRQREGASLLLWMTLWQSEWGKTPRSSAMPPIKGSILTSWRWTGDLESSLVSWRACLASLHSQKGRACPGFKIRFLIHRTPPPMLEVVPRWKWTTGNMVCTVLDGIHGLCQVSLQIHSVVGRSLVFNNLLVLRVFLLVMQRSSPNIRHGW